MLYIILAILIIGLSQINIIEKYFSPINTLIYSSYVVIAFLLLNGYFADDVRHFLRGIFDYFELSLDYAEDRGTERNMKNLDLVYFIAYAYSLLIFFITLVSVCEEFINAQKQSFKKQFFGMIFFLIFIFLGYVLFDGLSSMDPIDMERTDGMTSHRSGFFTNQFGIVFTSVGLIGITAMCSVYTKAFITTSSQTLGKILLKLKKGVNK